MIAINSLCSLLPIDIKGKYQLRMLSFKDLDWYTHNCREPYYNKYLDFSFAKDVSLDKLQSVFYNLTVGYTIKATNVSEARLVLVDSNNDIIGGCTLFEKEYEKEYEIAYFIIPRFQNLGIGEAMVKGLLSHLKHDGFKFNSISAVVMSSNKASSGLLENIGFKLTSEYKGRRGVNKVYTIEIDIIKGVEIRNNKRGNRKR